MRVLCFNARWVLAVILLSASACTFITPPVLPSDPPANVPVLPSFAGIAQKVLPAVAFIRADTPTEISSGSGVILTADGYILTNKHIIKDAQTIEVTLNDRRAYNIEGKWIDDITDLAVLKISEQNLPTVPFANPDTIHLADWVLAVGHAQGKSPQEGGAAVTFGLVSNLGRSIDVDGAMQYDVIQTDAAINPGNSGGPLLNMAGEMIGVNTAVVLNAQNVAFAINVATARHVFEDLVKYGAPHHPLLGVIVQDTLPPRPGSLPLGLNGAQVNLVAKGGPAEKAGLRPGDIIVSFDGQTVESAASLIKMLWRHDVQDTVDIIYLRNAIQYTVRVPLIPRDRSSFI